MVCSGCGTEMQMASSAQLKETPPVPRWPFLAMLLGVMVIVLVVINHTAQSPRWMGTIEIIGTATFNDQIGSSLMLLRTRSPQSYGVVTTYIGRIVQAKHSGMAAYKSPPTLELNDRTVFNSLTWCASSIAHDSIHSKLYADYLKLHPASSVPDEIWTGAEVERQCCEHQTRVLREIGAPLSEISWSARTNDRYWEIDYAKRDW